MVPVALVALLSLAGAAEPPAPPAPPPAVCVVAHAGVPDDPDPAALRRIFLLQERFWSDGTAVRPVNLPAGTPLREAFSERVLGRPSRDLAFYWNERYFHGTRPPPVVASQDAVLLFVARTPGGIGYVAPATVGDGPPDGVALLGCLPPRSPR